MTSFRLVFMSSSPKRKLKWGTHWTKCGKNAEFFNTEGDVTYNHQCALKVWKVILKIYYASKWIEYQFATHQLSGESVFVPGKLKT